MWYISGQQLNTALDCDRMMPKDSPEKATAELTEREQEILRLLATGTSNKEMAQQLFISSNTVKVHLRNIFAKIGAASRTEAAMYAVHSGLVKSLASTEQADDDSTSSNAIAGEVLAHSRPIFRVAIVTAILVVLVVVVGIGIFLARQQTALTLATRLATPTAESRWQILANLPTARTGLAIASYENQVYAIGGENSQGVTGVVERYDPATDSWSELSRKPVAVTDAKAAEIGGRIYVPGGRTFSGPLTNVLDIYNPQQDKWETGKNLPVAMSAYALATLEGRLYLFGGWDGKNYLNSVFIYIPSENQWEISEPMPESLAFAGAAVAADKIYVIGGYNGKQPLKSNLVFSPFHEESKSPWNEAESIPVGRYAFGIAAMADNIYILGGKAENNDHLQALVYDTQTGDWQQYESPPINTGSDLSLTPLGQYLYAIGANGNEGVSGFNLSFRAIYTVLLPVVK